MLKFPELVPPPVSVFWLVTIDAAKFVKSFAALIFMLPPVIYAFERSVEVIFFPPPANPM